MPVRIAARPPAAASRAGSLATRSSPASPLRADDGSLACLTSLRNVTCIEHSVPLVSRLATFPAEIWRQCCRPALRLDHPATVAFRLLAHCQSKRPGCQGLSWSAEKAVPVALLRASSHR